MDVVEAFRLVILVVRAASLPPFGAKPWVLEGSSY